MSASSRSRLVVPALLPHLEPGAHLVCLVKPQFEAGRDQVGKGGIVRDEAVRRRVIDDTVAAIAELGFELVGVIPSPDQGPEGQPGGARRLQGSLRNRRTMEPQRRGGAELSRLARRADEH